MRSQSAKRLNHRTTCSPSFEALEDRWCPAVTMRVVEGHILEVMGDRGNNSIEIDLLPGQVSVTGDGASRSFRGIDMAHVNTWAGDDYVRLMVASNELPDDSDFMFMADLGVGNNGFTLLCPSDPSAPPPNPDRTSTLAVTVHGGARQNMFQTVIGRLDLPPSTPTPHLGFGLNLEYDGGPRNNAFDAQFSNVALDQQVDLTERGGEGQNQFNTTFTNVALPAVQRGGLTENLIGGQGANQISTNLLGNISGQMQMWGEGGPQADHFAVLCNLNPQSIPQAMLAFHLGGGGGDDVEMVLAEGGQPRSLDVTMMGDAGNDQLSMTTDFLAMGSSELPAVQSNLDVEGGLGNDAIHYMKRGATMRTESAILNGGLGNDTIIEAAAAGIISAVGSVDRTEMDGGAGDDLLMFFDLPTDAGTVLGYSYELTMHGGAGNDTLIADVSYFGPGHPGDTASILEYGDSGDDQHILLANSGPFATLLIDGGLGNDGGLSPSSHSPNVTVINCEY